MSIVPSWTLIVLPLFLAYVALAMAALIGLARAGLPSMAKAVWVLVIVVAPVLGSLCWFFIGKGSATSDGVS